MIFDAKLISSSAHNQRKPTKVVIKATRETLARFQSRRECADALKLHESYISLLIYGRTKQRLIDAKYGELEILDDPVLNVKLVSPEAPQERQESRPSVTTSQPAAQSSSALDGARANRLGGDVTITGEDGTGSTDEICLMRVGCTCPFCMDYGYAR